MGAEAEAARLVRWRRRTGTIFWGLVGIFSIAASIQVGVQLFSPAPPDGPTPPCGEGIALLQSSLDAAWAAARREDDAPERALARFRAEVGPAWRHLPALQRACRDDRDRSTRLDALERLRYALESRVRVDGGSLAALRRRALGSSTDGTDGSIRGADPTPGPTGDPTAPADEEGPEPPARSPSPRPAPSLRPADDPSRNETR